jgi:hypothetical protein
VSITPSLVANRTSGVAPLAVVFDAWGTTSTASSKPGHECFFHWNYGEPTLGNWEYSGKSKNTDRGPVGAHVYETAGTYTVTLYVQDPDGTTSSATTTITVTDPDTVFSGTNTICFSTSGTFTGAPAGASQVTTSSWETVGTYIETGHRLLLRRGETWTADTYVRINVAGPGTIGAFGTGADPIVSRTTAGEPFIYLSGRTHACSDWRVMDVEFDGESTAGSGLRGDGEVSFLTMLRLTVHHTGTCLALYADILTYWNGNGYPGHQLHSGIVAADCDLNTLTGGSGSNHWFGCFDHGALIGNRMYDSTGGEHCCRISGIQTGLVAHNYLSTCATVKCVVKFHSGRHSGTASDPNDPFYGEWTENWVFSDNTVIAGSLPDWPVVFGPENSISDERGRNGIVENNYFLGGATTQEIVRCHWPDTTIRNNVLSAPDRTGLTAAIDIVEISASFTEIYPARCTGFNNSFYCPGTSAITVFLLGSGATDNAIYNNLSYCPNRTETMISGSPSGLTQGNNLSATTPGFVTTPPTTAAEFMLAAGSAAIDAGSTQDLYYDYRGFMRTGTFDQGAYEYGASAYTEPGTGPRLYCLGIKAG